MFEESFVKLRVDLAVALALLMVAKAGRPGQPNPETCLYLGDRYHRLAEHHRKARRFKKSNRLRAKAKYYLALVGPGSGPEPPYAAAMAMPVPKPPAFTTAIGRWPGKDPPDDAA
ncbi:MAG: hypothetical protein FJ143_03690 [Deltaproteobacteria bacterium]|nr:hypothetical protein [Deltaproteobacteria bacterium]